jgi:hypothetical protein
MRHQHLLCSEHWQVIRSFFLVNSSLTLGRSSSSIEPIEQKALKEELPQEEEEEEEITNQTEEEEVEQQKEEEEEEEAESIVPKQEQKPPQVTKVLPRVPSILSVIIHEPMKKSIQAPVPPRRSRVKFHFQTEERESMMTRRKRHTIASFSNTKRKSITSSTTTITTTISSTKKEQRRQSLSIASSSSRNANIMSPSKRTGIVALRRKSLPLVFPTTGTYTSTHFNPSCLIKKSPRKPKNSTVSDEATATASSSFSSSSSITCSNNTGSSTLKMTRLKNGTQEITINKKFFNFWGHHRIRMPLMQLGPYQHGIMLRQLRFVKGIMQEIPWAKAHLRHLLAQYTAKDISKEELYPQLNYLSDHVKKEIETKTQAQNTLITKKNRIALKITLAQSIMNQMDILKFGRRGKPHATKLIYDGRNPLELHWISKKGEKSEECLNVDEIQVVFGPEDAVKLTPVLKRAVRKQGESLDLNACVSLVTPSRTLDLQLKSSIHRDWLVNSLNDLITFAIQYKAVGVRKTRLLRRM